MSSQNTRALFFFISILVSPLDCVRLFAWPLRSDRGAHAACHIWFVISQERPSERNTGLRLCEGMQRKYVGNFQPTNWLHVHAIYKLDFEQYTPLIPDLHKKQAVTNQSLGKIEDGLLLSISRHVSPFDR